jgi:membrane-associated phospholipid phosphatase
MTVAEPRPQGRLGRVRAFGGRLLPAGPLDLLVQFAVIAAAYISWRYARGAVDGSTMESIRHARDLVDAERWLGTFIEPDVQDWALDHGWPADVANWVYSNVHFTGSWLALSFIYLFRRDSYGFVRNTVIAAMFISFLGYWLYPTAPPRFVPELGIIDTIASAAGRPPEMASGDAYFNAFAAVPSMHIGLSSIFGVSLALLVRPRALKVLFLCYPLLFTYVVIATGNHFWLDGLFGLITAAIAAAVALGLARLRPEWSFHPRAARPLRAGPPRRLLRRGAAEPESGEHAA